MSVLSHQNDLLFSRNLWAVICLYVGSGLEYTTLPELETPNSVRNILKPTPEPVELPTTKLLFALCKWNGATELALKVCQLGSNSLSV